MPRSILFSIILSFPGGLGMATDVKDAPLPARSAPAADSRMVGEVMRQAADGKSTAAMTKLSRAFNGTAAGQISASLPACSAAATGGRISGEALGQVADGKSEAAMARLSHTFDGTGGHPVGAEAAVPVVLRMGDLSPPNQQGRQSLSKKVRKSPKKGRKI